MMVDPLGHEHAVGRAGEEDRKKGERVSARIDQPPRGQRQRKEQQKVRNQGRDRDRPPFRTGSAEHRAKKQDQSRDRQIDQPRPVDVRAKWGVHPVLAKVEPALPVQQRAHLHDPHIVVGVAETEVADVAPLVEDEPAAKAEPGQEGDQLPLAREPVQHARDYDLVLALPHLSRCSRQTLNGKQADMATRLNVRNETFGQLARFAVVGLFLAGIYSAIYWYLAANVMAPVLAVAIAFLVAVSIGFVLHSRWSFRGHGRTEDRRMKV